MNIKCDICSKEFQESGGKYGRCIPSYNLNVCMSCYKGNHDGWNSTNEEVLIKHLEKNDIPVPERNEKGWIPREI